MNRPLLLRMLDGLVDAGPAGFEGLVGVAVCADHSVQTWYGAFDKVGSQTGFVDFIPEDADALLVLGTREADAIVHTGSLPSDGKRVAFGGDRTLIHRLLERFVHTRSALDLRTSGWKQDRS